MDRILELADIYVKQTEKRAVSYETHQYLLYYSQSTCRILLDNLNEDYMQQLQTIIKSARISNISALLNHLNDAPKLHDLIVSYISAYILPQLFPVDISKKLNYD